MLICQEHWWWMNGSWKDFHLRCSSNDMQIGDWECCNVVATVHFMGENSWRVSDGRAKWPALHCWWKPGVVSVPEIPFRAPMAVGDPMNTTLQASNTCISPWTNPSVHNVPDPETVKTVIDQMTNWTYFKLCNLLSAENPNLTHKNQNTSIDELQKRWNIHLALYDTLTSRAKPLSDGQLSYCAWRFGIVDHSPR